MIVGHIGGAGAPYEIQKSLRFRASASAYLSRTPSIAGNRKTWTWSGWVKRGTINAGANMLLFSATGTTFDNCICFTGGGTNDLLRLQLDGNNAGVVPAVGVFRDPSAWYHIIISVDTTQATAANRVRIYVNGAEVVYVSATYPTQNYATMFNSANAHNIGRSATSSNQNFDGYLSEINFIDGQALDPSYFGEVSAETGAWIPKKYTGTYGTNGFYLPFNDGSSLANLTADKSGNGNNWTANNISLTSGVTYDWMDDTPSNNFAVWNPLIRTTNNSGSISQSDGNLSSNIGAYANTALATQGVTSGKWYWEVTPVSTTGTDSYHVGVAAEGFNRAAQPNADPLQWAYYGQTGTKMNNSNVAYGATFTVGNVIGVALDMDAGTITFYKNNVSQGQAFSNVAGTVFPMCSYGNTPSAVFTGNFGQRPFSYAPPTGFKALCTKNLPTPSILNPKKHFDAVTFLGTSGNVNITGVGFQPDFVWNKARSNVQNHEQIDSVRGVNKQLSSSTTSAELTLTTPPTFNADGWTSTTDTHTNGYTYVSWLWKAGGAPVANNSGSIQSQVSANPQAGFSIVTYTGTGANATVGHGLGVAPKLILIKRRNNVGSWIVYHTLVDGSLDYMTLNSTAANANAVVALPTSSVFYVNGTSVDTDASGGTYVAYCFAEIPGYSKFGSYVGNGSADGPFVYCGFRPRWIMLKRVDSDNAGTAYWFIYDTTRNTFNAVTNWLAANLSAAESATSNLHIYSNGFKWVNDTGGSVNASGGTYIFAAFAEQPFKFANAR